jgi:hypothetical protein
MDRLIDILKIVRVRIGNDAALFKIRMFPKEPVQFFQVLGMRMSKNLDRRRT